MPKPKYNRKTTQQSSWEEEHVKNAVTEVIAGRIGYYKASKEFHIPQSMLKAKVWKLGVTAEEVNKKGKHNFPDTLFQIHFIFTISSYKGHPCFILHKSFLMCNKQLTESFFCYRLGKIQTSI